MTRREEDDGVEITIEVITQETAKAILCEVDGENVWIPKSQILEGEDDIEPGAENVRITVATWLAEKEGWA